MCRLDIFTLSYTKKYERHYILVLSIIFIYVANTNRQPEYEKFKQKIYD